MQYSFISLILCQFYTNERITERETLLTNHFTGNSENKDPKEFIKLASPSFVPIQRD